MEDRCLWITLIGQKEELVLRSILTACACVISQGKYKDDDANDANSAASYIGREWSNLAPFDADAPGGAS
jgi:hypothetical protein